MHRRSFLATLGTASVGALAGCSIPSSTRLTDPRVQDDDGETHLVYRIEDDRVAITTVQYDSMTDSALIRMRLSVWHRQGTTIEDLSVTVRSWDPSSPPPEVYLAAPTNEFPAVHFSRDENGDGRRFSVPGIDEVGTGTVSLDWYLRSFEDEWPLDLAVDVAYDLDGGLLKTYTVDGTVEFELERQGTFD